MALLFILPAAASAGPLIVLPSRLVVAEEDGRQFISVRENGSEIEAKVQFVTSWNDPIGLLRARHGEEFYELDLVKVDVVPTRLDFASSFFTKANPAVVDAWFEYGVNRVTARLRFNRDYSVNQIREALTFPVSLGTVDARIICLGSMVTTQCGAELKRIPLINRHAIGVKPEEYLLNAHYVYLRAYASQLMITTTPYLSEEFSEIVRKRYWAGGNCEQIGAGWHREACLIARNYSSPSRASLSKAVIDLWLKLFSEESFGNGDYFLVEGEQFGLRQLNLELDFEKVRQGLNKGFMLQRTAPGIHLGFPLGSVEEALHHFRFNIQRNALSWREREIVLASGYHMWGEAQLTLSNRGRRYSIPVSYKVHLGFSYDPMAQEVALNDIHIADLEFLEKGGPDYNLIVQNRSVIEFFIKGYFTSAEEKAKITEGIKTFLKQLQDERLEFKPFL
jgi:hypothetical protein